MNEEITKSQVKLVNSSLKTNIYDLIIQEENERNQKNYNKSFECCFEIVSKFNIFTFYSSL